MADKKKTKSCLSRINTDMIRKKKIFPGLLKTLTVSHEHQGRRLDQYISELTEISRSQIQKLIGGGNITISNKPARKNHKVRYGEKIIIELLPECSDILMPQDIPLEIVYRDDHLIVINKPHGMVMYPAAGHITGTLMNAIAFQSKRLASIGAPLRPGVVHRLDKDTSGLVVVALTDKAYYSLQHQFKERTVVRNYLAIVFGRMKTASGEINAPIGRALSDRKKMSTKTRSGKQAVTHYNVLDEFQNASLILARLATGRTHQIRVHFASIGHPLLGDKTYGRKTVIETRNKVSKVQRQMLHAQTLGFIHPDSGKEVLYTSSLPEDMEELLSLFTQKQ